MSRYSMSFSRAILTESFHRRSKAVYPNEKCVNSHVSACCSRKTGWTTIQISSYAIFEHVSNALSDTVKEAFSRGRWLTPVTRLWTNAEHRLEQLKKATDRIQKEIEEVTEREHELRNVGSIKTTSHETVDSKVRRMPQALASGKLKRTTSTPQILEAVNLTPSTPTLTPKMTNGVISSRTTPTPLRFATAPSQKGLMHRFLATRGKIYKPKSAGNDALTPPMAPSITLNPLSIKAFNRSLEIQLEPDDEPKKPPVRKGYVPVEEKIQKELHEMKERENELRLMRSQMLAKSQPNLLDIGNDNDSDIYDGSSSLRSGTSTNTLNEDEIEKEAKGKHKPNPRRRSTLIAQWENLIAAKKESNDNNNESDLNF